MKHSHLLQIFTHFQSSLMLLFFSSSSHLYQFFLAPPPPPVTASLTSWIAYIHDSPPPKKKNQEYILNKMILQCYWWCGARKHQEIQSQTIRYDITEGHFQQTSKHLCKRKLHFLSVLKWFLKNCQLDCVRPISSTHTVCFMFYILTQAKAKPFIFQPRAILPSTHG